jgi:alpha-tubulin suppressor-like RCC1 family protein
MWSHAAAPVVLLVSPLLFLLRSEPVCISRTDGSWLGFGYNAYGQLGLGDFTNRDTPTALTALGTSVVESCALGEDHTICKK